ncbi:hypothetical protein FACS189476_08850 [Spirochaetia bacterium]|nr:hypothetical protein FACS189476_08850 [Spirochaetia bacterium]
MISDGIDSIELETGRREEGSVYATYSMMRKIAQGVGQALIPFIIALALPGLDMKNRLTWNADYGLQIKNMAVLLCLVGYILTFIIMRFLYDIDKKKEMKLPALLGRSVKETDSAVDAVAKNVSRRDE